MFDFQAAIGLEVAQFGHVAPDGDGCGVAEVVRAQLLPQYPIASDGLLKVRQAKQNDTTIDVEDRVELGRRFIDDAVSAGL